MVKLKQLMTYFNQQLSLPLKVLPMIFGQIVLAFFLLNHSSLHAQKFKSKDNQDILIGRWYGSYNTTKVTLYFNNDNTGKIYYSTNVKPYLFKYKLKGKGLIYIYSGERGETHSFEFTDGKLHLKRYPKGLYESISLIDLIQFHK